MTDLITELTKRAMDSILHGSTQEVYNYNSDTDKMEKSIKTIDPLRNFLANEISKNIIKNTDLLKPLIDEISEEIKTELITIIQKMQYSDLSYKLQAAISSKLTHEYLEFKKFRITVEAVEK